METYSIQPRNKIELHIKEGFYYAQAMVSIKAIGLTDPERIHGLYFNITYKSANGNEVKFPLTLEFPYFFGAGTFDGREINQNIYPGPFYFVEIESSPLNPSLAIQVGFTDKLA